MALRARMRRDGPRLVLVSSLRTEETPETGIDMLLAADTGVFRIRTDRLPARFSGAGDMLAALFLFHVLDTGDAVEAARRASGSVAGVLWQTWKDGAAELQLVVAQTELVAPTRPAAIERC
jgi:pyridoxine kinase